MDFSKRKYVDFEEYFVELGFLPSTYYKKINFWGKVKLQNNHISEIIEFGIMKFYTDTINYDELETFLTGRKLLLIEKEKRFKEKDLFFKINLEKIIMSNGNSYYTIAL